MARNYAAEYAARVARSQRRGFSGYREERAERARLDTLELHPNFLRPNDFPLTSTEPHGVQGPSTPATAPDYDYYWPTRTINPPRPRTLQARYSRVFQRVEILFREGEPYTYYGVPPEIWTHFKRVESPGRFINATLNDFEYRRGVGWGSIVGEGGE